MSEISHHFKMELEVGRKAVKTDGLGNAEGLIEGHLLPTASFAADVQAFKGASSSKLTQVSAVSLV